jgi:hypothetical protein
VRSVETLTAVVDLVVLRSLDAILNVFVTSISILEQVQVFLQQAVHKLTTVQKTQTVWVTGLAKVGTN